MPSKIDWCDETINPLGWGCYGPGGTAERPRICVYCYALKFSRRKMRDCPDCRAFKPHWHSEQLELLYRWRKPRRVFVQSMGDLFGDWVPASQIGSVFVACNTNPRHTYLFLTKNPRGVPHYLQWPERSWLGVSVTNQADADERIPLLLQTPAAHRFVSFEPLLSAVDLERSYWDEDRGCHLEPMIDWAILGAQTGAGSKPIDPEWVSDLTLECDAYRVPVFHKGSLARMGFTRREMP